MGSIIVPVDEQLCSTLKIGSDAFPFQLFHDDLNQFVQGFVNWHRQNEIEISCILEGSIRVCLLKEEHILHAGDAFVLLPHALHSIQPIPGKAGKYFTLIFTPTFLTSFPGSYFDQAWYSPLASGTSSYIPIPEEASEISAHLSFIYENAHNSSDIIRLLIQRHLQDLWIALAQQVHPAPSPVVSPEEDKRILRMIDDLRAHHAEPFSLAQLAERMHLSRGECCRHFKKMMGMTITDYLIDYRLSKAAECLIHTQMHMADIALKTGFSSPSSFSAEFKKRLGCTPSQYRSAMR